MVRRFKHPWEVTPNEAIKIQKSLAPHIIKQNSFRRIERIAGVGVVFSSAETKFTVAAVKLAFPSLKVLTQVVEEHTSNFPYIAGFFAFCVGPAMLSVLEKIGKTDLIIFPGRGIAHARNMGLATHLGILLDIPTIGCSKRTLWKNYKIPGLLKGARTFILDSDGERIGAALRSRNGTNPIFVTTGHKISLISAVKITLRCCTRYRIPEPLRQAHVLAKRFVYQRKR